MQNVWKDLRFALRQLRRSPGFAITAVLTLALGIGANTAIFSLLDQALLRALPVQDPSGLVVLRDSSTVWSGSISMSGGDQNDYFSYPEYLGLRDHGHGFSGLAATISVQAGFLRGTSSEIATSEVVSGNYFETVGVTPHLGRMLLPSDDGKINANPVAVLSFAFWRDKLGSDPSVVNSMIKLNGHSFQVLGVASPGFHSIVWGQNTDIFVPLSMLEEVFPAAGNRYNNHQYKWLSIVGRLAPGYTIASAEAANAPLWHAMRANDLSLLGTKSANFSAGFLSSRLLILPGARGFSFNRSALEAPFLAVMAMAVLVLLIASVNVASLLMVRSNGRAREFALRAALGASSARLISQLLLEGVLIGISGGVVGVLLAPFALRALISRLADQTGQTPFSAVIDSRVLLFNFAVAVLVSLCFSLFPALQARRPNLNSTLRESSGTGGTALLQVRRVIVCVQIGLSVVLLVAAGLFIRTLHQLRALNVGFNTSHLVVFSTDPALAGYSAEATSSVDQHVLDGLSTIPGIDSVAASTTQELVPQGSFYGINLTGYERPPDDTYQVQNTTVTPSYLETLKIPLLAGRNLTSEDTLDHPKVALVNRVFVKHFCDGSDQSCIGRRITYNSAKAGDPGIQIVGVFGDYQTRGIREPAPATMFIPLKQDPPTLNPNASQLFFYLRTKLAPGEAIGDVRAQMHRVDPTLALGPVFTMDEQVDLDLQNERMITLLAISFGALATVLAGVGLYGVLAYSTAQRTREIGIRMALGSTRIAVSSLVVKDVLGLATIGVVIAIPVAYGLSILVRSQLFGVSAADPGILLSVTALIAIVAILAALLPARRAASVDPTEALRIE